LLNTLKTTILFWLIPFIGNAQLQVQQGTTPEQLVQNNLLGEGIELLNVTFNGQSQAPSNIQFGTFSNGWEAIGISEGLILSTGDTKIAEGPNELSTAFSEIEENELIIEPDLTELVGQNIDLNDVAILEFDFVASGDTLRFSYVFASEEYNEHTCSPYNDAFGFFISGPGLTGDGSFMNNAINVATVPNSDVPVTINSVNKGESGIFGSNAICNAVDVNWQQNSQYFVDNESNEDINTTEFDGFTRVFQIKVPVECGGTYKIKMAIADAVDGKNDSAVFIKSKSFETEVPLEVDYTVINPIDGIASEGCSQFDFKLSRGDSSSTKVVYLKSEFAQNYPDVLPDFPDSLVFYAEQGIIDWELPINYNNLFESERIFDIAFLQPNVCGFDTSKTLLQLPLTDFPDLIVEYDEVISSTCDETAQVNILIDGGLPPYTIEWEGDYQGFQFPLDQTSSTDLNAVISDQCNLHTENITIQYAQEEYAPLQLTTLPEIEINCTTPLEYQPLIAGGRGDYTISWEFNGSVISESIDLIIPVPEEGELLLTVEDGCVPSASATIQLKLPESAIQVDVGEDFQGFCGQEITIIPQISGGIGGIAHKWKRNFATESFDPTFSFVPFGSSIVILEATDQCGKKGFDTLTVFVENVPIEILMPSDTSICVGRVFDYIPPLKGGYGNLDYLWLENGSDSLRLVTSPEHEVTYTLQVTDDCQKTSTSTIKVELVDVKADFSFDYDNLKHPIINHSLKGYSYSWTLPNGETSMLFEPVFHPNPNDNDQLILLEVLHPLGCLDSKIDFFEPPLNVFIPTAFTPDGDGLNDIFKAEGTFINEFEMWVYDRWGNLVFHSTDPTIGWDGSDEQVVFSVQNNIYSYRVLAKGYNEQIFDKRGSVTVLR